MWTGRDTRPASNSIQYFRFNLAELSFQKNLTYPQVSFKDSNYMCHKSFTMSPIRLVQKNWMVNYLIMSAPTLERRSKFLLFAAVAQRKLLSRVILEISSRVGVTPLHVLPRHIFLTIFFTLESTS